MISIGVTVVTSIGTKDLSLSYNESDDGAALIGAIRSGLGETPTRLLRVLRTGVVIDPDQRLADLDLVHGDIIDASGSRRTGVSAQLRRVDGEGVGASLVEIPVGGLKIGRLDVGNDLVLHDETVSKMHASISLKGSQVVLEDLESLNGTKVGGHRITTPHVLRDGDLVDFGDDSVFVFQSATPDTDLPAARWKRLGDHLQRSAGRLYISRSWREMRPRPAGTVSIEAAPDRISQRRFPLPMIVLPVVLGAAIVALTGNVMFLAFGALGPMMAIWNWWDDRQSGARRYRSESERYLNDIETASIDAEALRTALRDWLERALPTTEQLVDWAVVLEPKLWDRHRSHPDFLEVRIGSGMVASEGRVQVSERGAPDLVARARELKESHARDPDMPVSLRLHEVPVVSIMGPTASTTALARSLLTQLAVRNSPNDVRIACIGGDWSWARWLPHVSQTDEPPLIGTDPDSIGRTMQSIETRIANVTQRSAAVDDRIVLVVQPPIPVPPARLNALLAAASQAQISIVWLADASGPPPESLAVITAGNEGTLQIGNSPAIRLSTVEALDGASASTVARSLAPLVDPGSSTEGTIPERVGLLDVIGADCADADAVLQKWRRPHDSRLLAPMGVGKDGVITLDLSSEGDGPNGLVGGTVGAGKSEFLQSLVLALAATYGPDELNFLFVDFKGGATFHGLLDLPHVVGMVRNLDGDLALRAQKSLQAEFRRRQQILPANNVQKMSDLRAIAPEKALPSLVVVIDEYAELSQKLPEFLDAVVELAQTGRALGLHLLLATQAPGQSVSRTIQNCVKYRISFRLKDSSESTEVLGRGRDASTLPNRPGRGLFLDGDSELHEFQAAWAGGRTLSDDDTDAVAVTMYGKRQVQQSGGPTDLERVLAAVIDAGKQGGYVAPRRPWHEPLPAIIPFDRLAPTEPMPGVNRVSLGILDLPSEQTQPPYAWDLSESANLIVFGDARTGKTSVLRTIAAASATIAAPGIEILGFDGAGGGLGSIDVLPNVRGVVQSQDTAGLRRAIAHLRREETTRRSVIGRAGSLQAHRRATGERVPDLVVLIDGLAQLLNTLEVIDGGALLNALNQLITDGAPVGIHFVLATDQPQRVPMAIKNTARERLVLRLASRDAASAAEVNRSLANLADGRAFSTGRNGDVQLAVLGDQLDLDGPAQSRALDVIGAALLSEGGHPAERLPLPMPTVRAADVGTAAGSDSAVVVGLDDLFLDQVTIDFAATPTLAIAGPDLTGRTNTITWIAQSLRLSKSRLVTVYHGGRGDPPPNESDWTHVFTELEGFTETLEAFAATVQERSKLDVPLFLAIDDCDELIANPVGLSPDEMQLRKRLAAAMDVLLRSGRSSGVIMVLAGRLTGLSSSVPWAQRFKQNSQAVLLAPATLDNTVTDMVFGVMLPRRSGYRPAPGSGVVVRRGEPASLVQLVLAGCD